MLRQRAGGAQMTGHDFLDLVAEQQSLILGNWNFFISTHFALIGAVLYFKRRLKPIEKAFVLLPYSVFMIQNYSGQVKNYVHLSEICRQALTAPELGAYSLLGSCANEPTKILQVPGLFSVALPVDWITFAYGFAALMTFVLFLVVNSLAERTRTD